MVAKHTQSVPHVDEARQPTTIPPKRLGFQIDFLSADTGKAFTTVLAGFAATVTSLPNIIFLPAFVAGFLFVLIITKPGITNLPALLTCAAPISPRASRIF